MLSTLLGQQHFISQFSHHARPKRPRENENSSCVHTIRSMLLCSRIYRLQILCIAWSICAVDDLRSSLFFMRDSREVLLDAFVQSLQTQRLDVEFISSSSEAILLVGYSILACYNEQGRSG